MPGAAACSRHAAQRLLFAAAALLVLALTTGCHKKAQVSRRIYPPPPPAASRSQERPPSTTAHKRTVEPPVVESNTAPVGQVEFAVASWYGPSGRRSANGEVYDGNSLTAAHRTLPLGTLIRVTNMTTKLAATVRITDRGPFVPGRSLDLSIAAAKATGVYRMGIAQVRIEVVQQRPDVSPVGKWCVQVGAFLDEENASRLKNDLLRRYSTSAKVIQFAGSTGSWVRVNPLVSDRAHADAIAQSVRVTEPDAQAYLVRLD